MNDLDRRRFLKALAASAAASACNQSEGIVWPSAPPTEEPGYYLRTAMLDLKGEGLIGMIGVFGRESNGRVSLIDTFRTDSSGRPERKPLTTLTQYSALWGQAAIVFNGELESFIRTFELKHPSAFGDFGPESVHVTPFSPLTRSGWSNPHLFRHLLYDPVDTDVDSQFGTTFVNQIRVSYDPDTGVTEAENISGHFLRRATWSNIYVLRTGLSGTGELTDADQQFWGLELVKAYHALTGEAPNVVLSPVDDPRDDSESPIHYISEREFTVDPGWCIFGLDPAQSEGLNGGAGIPLEEFYDGNVPSGNIPSGIVQVRLDTGRDHVLGPRILNHILLHARGFGGHASKSIDWGLSIMRVPVGLSSVDRAQFGDIYGAQMAQLYAPRTRTDDVLGLEFLDAIPGVRVPPKLTLGPDRITERKPMPAEPVSPNGVHDMDDIQRYLDERLHVARPPGGTGR